MNQNNSIKLIVFDFDGTLVLSNQLKYDAYFRVFPDDECHRSVITKVLEKSSEESRFVILESIVQKIRETCAYVTPMDVSLLAENYNSIVEDGAKNCAIRPGAEKVIKMCSAILPLYLSSNTPEQSLREIIRYRQWSGYFKDIFGYPKKKYKTLLNIIKLEKKLPRQVLVVGDGDSDRNSAIQAGCVFFYATPGVDLENVITIAL